MIQNQLPSAGQDSIHLTPSFTVLHPLHIYTDGYRLTNPPSYTSLRHIRQDTRHHWRTYSPNRALHTAVTRLRTGHTRLNAHLHRLGMTDSPHCPWCPTQPDTPEHLLLHCPHHHSHRVALLHSLSAIHPHRPTLTDLQGSCTNATQAFKTLNLQKTNQLHHIRIA
ncbi:hypothetical protein E2C01_048011 [Portunus trituberculatus]|uniref:Reverse transcriptase zinc-binding domain-containing protein n=1 Tax=Portunus trituberculatus TaxID=210409 RepID=A0A5B7GC33_PORTR|nr:hypothetical protein [Portunus trituberculatus]